MYKKKKMTKQKPLSIKQRITELKNLISDGVSLGFAPHLIMGYNEQLTALQEVIEKENKKRQKFRCQQNKK